MEPGQSPSLCAAAPSQRTRPSLPASRETYNWEATRKPAFSVGTSFSDHIAKKVESPSLLEESRCSQHTVHPHGTEATHALSPPPSSAAAASPWPASAAAVAAAASAAAVRAGVSPPELLVITRERRRSLPLPDCKTNSASSSASAASEVSLSFALPTARDAASPGSPSRRLSCRLAGRLQDAPFPSFLCPNWTDALAFSPAQLVEKKGCLEGLRKPGPPLHLPPSPSSFAELSTRRTSSSRSQSVSASPFDEAGVVFEACNASEPPQPPTSRPRPSSPSVSSPSCPLAAPSSSVSDLKTSAVHQTGSSPREAVPQDMALVANPRAAEDLSLFSSNLLHASNLPESLFNFSALDVSAIYGEPGEGVSSHLASSIFSFSGDACPRAVSPTKPSTASPVASANSSTSSGRSASAARPSFASGEASPSAKGEAPRFPLDAVSVSSFVGHCASAERLVLFSELEGGAPTATHADLLPLTRSAAKAASAPLGAAEAHDQGPRRLPREGEESRGESGGESPSTGAGFAQCVRARSAGMLVFVEREKSQRGGDESAVGGHASARDGDEKQRRMHRFPETQEERMRRIQQVLEALKRRNDALESQLVETQRRRRATVGFGLNSDLEHFSPSGESQNAEDGDDRAAEASAQPSRQCCEDRGETHGARLASATPFLPSSVLQIDSAEPGPGLQTPRFPTDCALDEVHNAQADAGETGGRRDASVSFPQTRLSERDQKEGKGREEQNGLAAESSAEAKGEEEEKEREGETMGEATKERGTNAVRTKIGGRETENQENAEKDRAVAAASGDLCTTRGAEDDTLWEGQERREAGELNYLCISSGQGEDGNSEQPDAPLDLSTHAASHPHRSALSEGFRDSRTEPQERRRGPNVETETSVGQTGELEERETLAKERRDLDEARAVYAAQKRELEEMRKAFAKETADLFRAREMHAAQMLQLLEQTDACLNEKKELEEEKKIFLAQKEEREKDAEAYSEERRKLEADRDIYIAQKRQLEEERELHVEEKKALEEAKKIYLEQKRELEKETEAYTEERRKLEADRDIYIAQKRQLEEERELHVEEKKALEEAKKIYLEQKRELEKETEAYTEERRKLEADRDIYVAQKRQLEEERELHVEEKKALEEAKKIYLEQKRELEKETEAYTEERRKLEADRDIYVAQKRQLEEERELHVEEKKALEEAKKIYLEQKRELEKETEAYTEERRKLEADRDIYIAQKRQLEEERELHVEEKKALEEAKKIYLEQKRELEKETEAYTEERRKLEADRDIYVAQKRQLEEERELHVEEKKALEEAKKIYLEQKRELEKETEAYTEERRKLEADRDIYVAQKRQHEEERDVHVKETRALEEKNELEKETKALQEEKNELEKETKALQEEKNELEKEKKVYLAQKGELDEATEVYVEARRKLEEKEMCLAQREELEEERRVLMRAATEMATEREHHAREKRQLEEERDKYMRELGEVKTELNRQCEFYIEEAKKWDAEQEKVGRHLKETEQLVEKQRRSWCERERARMEAYERLRKEKEELEIQNLSLQAHLNRVEERRAEPLAEAFRELEEAKRREGELGAELERERNDRKQMEQDLERLAQQNCELSKRVEESRGLTESVEHLQREIADWKRRGETAVERAKAQEKELERNREENGRMKQKLAYLERTHVPESSVQAAFDRESRHSGDAPRDEGRRHVSKGLEDVEEMGHPEAGTREKCVSTTCDGDDELESLTSCFSGNKTDAAEDQARKPRPPPEGFETMADTSPSSLSVASLREQGRERKVIDEKRRVGLQAGDEESRGLLVERLQRLYSEECASSRRLAAKCAQYRQQLRQVMKRLVLVTKAMEEANDLREKHQRVHQQRLTEKPSG
ncbi:hypothetical protein NCLIV_064740 [Neospora caninum Liverpool]|uniref:Uncharacterized protein n=1 Tax=Neospora caninum (strain Liverpool) TaxID=572307 RepID=F0VQQ1_NEOCL|nr:hypothetical protein NCLIV_064740 [Neospora caninum Liverpool]CBZ56048.1 hypothetical protein NCLIV_064740 [Neospora caninum Liverpool]|eukprot:XP_003886074.1 hypothetical protein NCLIV_064740 [Neospora caninum Liverpool]